MLANASAERKDRADARGQLARNEKASWLADFSPLAPEAVRREQAISDNRLIEAFDAYKAGFAEDLNDYYSGINALGLLTAILKLAETEPEAWAGRFETGKKAAAALDDFREQLDRLRGAVRMSLENAKQQSERNGKPDEWLPPSEAQYRLLTADNPVFVKNAYKAAKNAGGSVFSVDSEVAQVAIFHLLGLLPENCRAALEALGTPSSLSEFKAAGPLKDMPPRDRVIIGTGHRIDAAAGDELTERQYLVIDGIDGRAHYVEFAEPDQLDDVRRGGIVEVGPPPTSPRSVDRTIAAVARDSLGLYHPSEHVAQARQTIRVPHDGYGGYIDAHVRRLEALRRAGVVERIDADNWVIPEDFEQRAAEYDAQRRRTLSVRVLSAFDLEAQIASDGATWLDRQLVGRDRAQPVEGGFGQDVIDAKRRRVQVLIAQGFAERQGENRILVRRDLLATLEQREVTRVGQELAEKHGAPFRPAKDGERFHGTFKETLQLASGKYVLIENSREFTLVPWRPIIERELGREVAGLVRGSDISWEFGRKRSLGISM